MTKMYIFLVSWQILFCLNQIKCAAAFSLPQNNLRAEADEDGVGECSRTLDNSCTYVYTYVNKFKNNIKLFKMKIVILSK